MARKARTRRLARVRNWEATRYNPLNKSCLLARRFPMSLVIAASKVGFCKGIPLPTPHNTEILEWEVESALADFQTRENRV